MRILLFIIPIAIISCVNKGSDNNTKQTEERTEEADQTKLTEKVNETDVPSYPTSAGNGFEVFWSNFSNAVIEGDIPALDSLVYFPFVDFHNDVYDLQSSLTCRTKDDFIKRFDEIFNECVLTAIKHKKIRGYDKDYGEFGDVIAKDDFLLITGCEERSKDFLFRIINGRYYLYGIQYYQ